jgi:class 3 adenylate cyclase
LLILGFVVKMGCGLHYGWAIEGAIGSKFKIDASYLANNVNVAMDLEAATKIYLSNYFKLFLIFLEEILVSEDLYKVLNPFYQEICRKVDIVELNMEKKALYCVDIDLSHITVESELDVNPLISGINT